MTEKEEFELIQEACLSDGVKLLVEDIKKAKEASDTIKVVPLIENGVLICSQTDQMLKQQGQVAALEWVLGIIEHYQTGEYQESADELQD